MEWLSAAVDYGIIGLLVVMSIIAVSVAVGRMLVYRNIRLEDFNDKKTLEMELTKKLHLIATRGELKAAGQGNADGNTRRQGYQASGIR